MDEILGDDAPLFCAFYSITKKGNWEHTNILWVKEPIEIFAEKNGIGVQELEQKLADCRQKLMTRRSERIRPQTDDKILLGWNALLNTAYAKAYAALGDEAYREMAIRNMAFIESTFAGPDGQWFHTYKSGKARIPAFLDDLAYLVQAYIHLQEITGSGEYLIKAQKLATGIIEDFEEAQTGFFFYTHKTQKDVIVRKKEVYDGAVPSGNAVMIHNLLYLGIVFDRPGWTERARTSLTSLAKAITKYPGSFGVWATALQWVTNGTLEIAITGQRSKEFLRPVLEKYLPNKILQSEETNSHFFPLLAGKAAGERGSTAFYLCENYACKAPFSTVEALLANV
jgi:uncharacterized protein YyaL (SSP411 family)